jgi:hypothetical protein
VKSDIDGRISIPGHGHLVFDFEAAQKELALAVQIVWEYFFS